MPPDNQVVVVDFLLLDIDGTPIVVAEVHHRDAAPETVAEATAVRDSIEFVTGD